MPSLLEQARQFLLDRRADYRAVFVPGPSTDRVLKDLAKFCRAHTSTFHPDHSVSDRLDGRREVFLRISHNLQLTDDDLWALYGNQNLKSDTQE
jgi:hypothetical protein